MLALLPSVAAGVGATPPVSMAPPAISGTVKEGETLGASNGVWAGPAPITFTYQWQRCDSVGAACSNLPLATQGSYTVGHGSVGSTLRIVVTATESAGKASAVSKPTPVVGPPGHEAAEAGRWSLAISVTFLVLGVPLLAWLLRWIWWLTWGRRNRSQQPKLFWGRSLFVGQDERVSTSKTTALVWTYTLASALASFVVAKWLEHGIVLSKLAHQGIDAKYALLIGGPLGAAILAKSIVSAQVGSGDSARPPADSATPAQLVQNDAGQADLGDVQYLLFNLVALLFFYGEFLSAPQNGLPTIPDVLVGLTSVAAAGYVGKKALTGPAVISDVNPSAAHVGDPVKLLTSAIAKSGDDLSLITVTFGAATATAHPNAITETTTQGVLLDVDVPGSAAGKVDVTVSVPNGKSATWPGFKVIPEIGPLAAPLTGKPGTKVSFVTTGVSGLAPALLGVTATIGDKAVPVERDPGDPTNNTLRVTVPEDLAIPDPAAGLKTTLIVTTPGGSSQPAEIIVKP
jgi:hypothetical protein